MADETGGKGSQSEYRRAARRGEFDAVWWEHAEEGDPKDGIHVCVDGSERVVEPDEARELADRLEGAPDSARRESIAFVSDLRESADMLELLRSMSDQAW